jgi:probable phosphomutase (TIGR03848 family)
VTTVLLIRHGRTAANTDGVLAGWTPGVALDERGREQAQAVGRRLAALPLAAVVSSPLERCLETAQALVDGRAGARVVGDERLGECKYGDWTGRQLKQLAKDKLWKVVQAQPSAATFPGEGGESLREMQARAVAAVRDWDVRLGRQFGPGTVWVACSHGDVIKAVVADALGMHLDMFQRIVVEPGSVTAIRYTDLRPFLIRLNDVSGDAAAYRPPKTRRGRRSRGPSSEPTESTTSHESGDAVVGGGAGTADASA